MLWLMWFCWQKQKRLEYVLTFLLKMSSGFTLTSAETPSPTTVSCVSAVLPAFTPPPSPPPTDTQVRSYAVHAV